MIDCKRREDKREGESRRWDQQAPGRQEETAFLPRHRGALPGLLGRGHSRPIQAQLGW